MRFLAFSDIHGSKESVQRLIDEIVDQSYDAIIFAGDFTNAIFDGPEQGKNQMEEIVSLIQSLEKPLYYVYGNRDVDVECNYGYNLHEKDQRIGEFSLTNNVKKSGKKTIIVTHEKSPNFIISNPICLLYIHGHEHVGRIYGNSLDLGFLYRDESHGAKPLFGCYWFLTIEDDKISIENHRWQVREIICTQKPEHGTFYIPNNWRKVCPRCDRASFHMLSPLTFPSVWRRGIERPLIPSISDWLQTLGDDQWEVLKTESYRDLEFTAEVFYNVPDYFQEENRWIIFQFFVKRMLKKFFEDKVICRKATIERHNTKKFDTLQFLFSKDKRNPLIFGKDDRTLKQTFKLYIKVLKAVHCFKIEKWIDVLNEGWELSKIDYVFKTKNLPPKEPLSQGVVKELINFFKSIITWLNDFIRKEHGIDPIILIDYNIRNSELSTDTIDLMINNHIYEISVTDDVSITPKNEINKLLANLSEFNLESEWKLDHIGFLFPLQNRAWIKEIGYSKKSQSLQKRLIREYRDFRLSLLGSEYAEEMKKVWIDLDYHIKLFSSDECKLNPEILNLCVLKEKGKFHEIWQLSNFIYILMAPLLNFAEYWLVDEFENYEYFLDWVKDYYSTIFNEEYLNALLLKEQLINKFDGVKFTSHFKGRNIKTANSKCYLIESEHEIKPTITKIDDTISLILNELKLIKGIGPVKSAMFKTSGIKTIKHLVDSDQFRAEAKKVMSIIGSKNYNSLHDWVLTRNWVGKSHPIILQTSHFFDKQLIFLDIETLGFQGLPVFLIGIGYKKDEKFIIKQYFARDLDSEENGILEAVFRDLKDDSVIVSFNGRTFDIPVINERLVSHTIKKTINYRHFDLLYFARRAWKNVLPDCRLSTIEKDILKHERIDDIPSSMVPDFYEEYRRSGNIGPLIPILEHNKRDIISVLEMFEILKDILV